MSNPNNNPSNKWIKCISTDGTIRGVGIQATALVQSMAAMHQLRGIHARGLGEAVMGALLVASYCKEGERVNLNIRASGHMRQALVDAYPNGDVRGYVIGREEEAAFLGENNETGPWGTGMLSILRAKNEIKQPYIGTVPLITGHLAKDLTFYWLQSEQVPSAVGLAVQLDEGGRVAAAGGFLVQTLPGAAPVAVRAVEQHINEIESLAESIVKNADPVFLLSQIFQSTSFILLEEKSLQFACNCSRERVERALHLVGAEELKDMLLKDRKASVRCDFCTKEYTLDSVALGQLLKRNAGV